MAAISGRPDGRLSQYIYASGQGGVLRDMRYPTDAVTPTYEAEQDLRVKNGEYRGFEKRVVTKPYYDDNTPAYSLVYFQPDGTNSSIIYGGILVNLFKEGFYKAGDGFWVVNKSNGTIAYCTISGTASTNQLRFNSPQAGDVDFPYNQVFTGNEYDVWLQQPLPTSIGGSFLQTDVIGDPANILQTPALKDGWEGSWLPYANVPTATVNFSRKVIVANASRQYTQDNGGTWANIPAYIDPITNSVLSVGINGYVQIFNYQAYAKVTEPADNAVVKGGIEGIGSVFASSDSNIEIMNTRGTLLKESLVAGTIGIGSYVDGAIQTLSTKQGSLDAGRLMVALRSSYVVVHGEILIDGGAGINAFKVLNYSVDLNQQAVPHYAATELVWDGTDWGDDSKITIVDQEATKTDLNGNTVKVVTHKLKEPIGWYKNPY